MSTTIAQPKRIQRKRMKGSKLPAKTLCVSRTGIWGNPYPLSEFGELSIPLFRNTLRGVWDPSLLDGKAQPFRNRAYDLHHAWLKRFLGRHPLDVLRDTLRHYDFIACWCKLTDECHGDSLIELGP